MNPQEKAANREAFRKMDTKGKIGYILSYYWLLILVGLSVTVILISTLYNQLTKKDPYLYAGFFNVSVGSDLEKYLGEDFIQSIGLKTSKNEIRFYQNLYVSDDVDTANHQYEYASRIKLMGSIASKQLDVVFMNKEAWDILSGSGYLLDIQEFLSDFADLSGKLTPYLRENEVILEDNAIEFNLSEAESYQAITQKVFNGLDASGISAMREAGFPEDVYLGIIANTPRLEGCAAYLGYLYR